MSSVISVTSRVADYLERQPVGYQFTTTQLLKILNADPHFSGEVSHGAVSGVMHRAAELGLLSRELAPRDGRKNRPGYIYTLTSRFEMETRLFRGPGGAKGRTWSARVRSRVRACVKAAVLAEEELPLEGNEVDMADALSQFTTEQLWQELERRTQP